jgi:hypothetical protein
LLTVPGSSRELAVDAVFFTGFDDEEEEEEDCADARPCNAVSVSTISR